MEYPDNVDFFEKEIEFEPDPYTLFALAGPEHEPNTVEKISLTGLTSSCPEKVAREIISPETRINIPSARPWLGSIIHRILGPYLESQMEKYRPGRYGNFEYEVAWNPPLEFPGIGIVTSKTDALSTIMDGKDPIGTAVFEFKTRYSHLTDIPASYKLQLFSTAQYWGAEEAWFVNINIPISSNKSIPNAVFLKFEKPFFDTYNFLYQRFKLIQDRIRKGNYVKFPNKENGQPFVPPENYYCGYCQFSGLGSDCPYEAKDKRRGKRKRSIRLRPLNLDEPDELGNPPKRG